mmetsp:Transcript_89717/g.155273  ORF Transcript_89717/g.155273 Transcript_89717/m.155273 type:complete len:109 (+) Transcript_89717:528-854(+)
MSGPGSATVTVEVGLKISGPGDPLRSATAAVDVGLRMSGPGDPPRDKGDKERGLASCGIIAAPSATRCVEVGTIVDEVAPIVGSATVAVDLGFKIRGPGIVVTLLSSL